MHPSETAPVGWLTEVTEVDGLSTFAQEKQSVKYTEQLRGRLVNAILRSEGEHEDLGIGELTCKGWLGRYQQDSSGKIRWPRQIGNPNRKWARPRTGADEAETR